jgi:hypothetical protein
MWCTVSRYMWSVSYHAPKTALENIYVIFGLLNYIVCTEREHRAFSFLLEFLEDKFLNIL